MSTSGRQRADTAKSSLEYTNSCITLNLNPVCCERLNSSSIIKSNAPVTYRNPKPNPKEGLKEFLSGNGYRVPERPARLSNGPPVRPGREYVIRRFTLKRLLDYVIIT